MIQKPTSHSRQKINTLCHVTKLPPDILIEIFQISCESTQKSDEPITPLSFGRISNDWREIVWSTPLLWSTVSIKVSTRPSQVDLLRDWLIRAQSSPLSIYLTLNEDSSKWTPHAFCDVLRLLATRAEYWHTFDCLFPDEAECHDMLNEQNLPLLTSLSLRSQRLHILSTRPTISRLVPRLVRVELSGYMLLPGVAASFPLRQLRCFKAHRSSIRVTECLALLRSAQALKECYLDRIYPSGDVPSQTLHTELELLDILMHPSCTLLDNLTLPKLRVLAIDNAPHGDSGSFFITLHSLISRSSCQLERLDIKQGTPLGDNDILALLEVTPSLTHLSLLFDIYLPVCLSDKLVSLFRPSRHGSCLLPKLTSLQYCGPVLCDNRLLVEMLSERWHNVSECEGGQGVSRLIRADIVCMGKSGKDLPQDVRADIDMLVSEGMQLEIRWT